VVQWSVMAGCIKFRMCSIFGIAELVSFSLLLDFFLWLQMQDGHQCFGYHWGKVFPSFPSYSLFCMSNNKCVDNCAHIHPNQFVDFLF